MILKRGLLQFLLAALLLVAQYAALTHGLSHWRAVAAPQSQQEDGSKQKTQSALCDFHVAFTEVLGAIGSCGMPPAVAAQVAERSAEPSPVSLSARFLAPLSRGPPALL